MVRVRHYTRVSSMRKILAEGMIRARDQNKVFVELARVRAGSPRDVESRYRLKPGKANAYIEFDVEDAELRRQPNPRIGQEEFFIVGSVDLSARNVQGFEQN
jgi:hypothetical protein